jgi:hypothetical protein
MTAAKLFSGVLVKSHVGLGSEAVQTGVMMLRSKRKAVLV